MHGTKASSIVKRSNSYASLHYVSERGGDGTDALAARAATARVAGVPVAAGGGIYSPIYSLGHPQ